MRNLAILLALSVLGLGCGDNAKSPTPTRGRAAAVKAQKPSLKANDGGGFCEKAWPGEGPTARAFTWPPLRPLDIDRKFGPPEVGGQWTWLNVWATWCVPCLEEMGLLARWTKALEQEGNGIRLELLSIDAPKDEAKLQRRVAAGLPGTPRWLRGEADWTAFLDQIGVDHGAAIPIHVLIDPRGLLRCVRVGAISGQDYAAVKGILRGG